MKILHVAVFSPNSTNVWQADGFEALNHNVIRYDYRKRLSELGTVEKRDDEIIELCRKEQPDMVLFSKCNNMDKRVNVFCQHHSKSVMWYMDDIYNMNKEFMNKIPYSDYVFTSCPGCVDDIKTMCSNVYRIHGGYDSVLHKPIDIPKIRGAAFIGDLRPYRQEFRKHVEFDVINGVYGLDHSKAVSETKINISFTEGRGVSNRIYKLMAAGGFVLTQPWVDLSETFTVGEHLDVFETVDELKEKIKFYLDNEEERNTIALRGSIKVKDYDNINYAKNIIDKVFKYKE